MLKLGRVTKVKVLFLVLVFVFNFDLFKFSAAILEKVLLLATRLKQTNGKCNRLNLRLLFVHATFILMKAHSCTCVEMRQTLSDTTLHSNSGPSLGMN